MMRCVEFEPVRRLFQRAAAPGGGARNWVRGCVFALVAVTPTTSSGQELPSGQTLELFEVLVDKVGEEDWIRFRFLAPEIARELGRLSYGDVEPDMAHLCDALALDYLEQHALVAEKIAISLSDREVPFGTSDPDATQFVEVYRVDGDRCIWEAF